MAWVCSEACLELPADNLGERMAAANELIELLRKRGSTAPLSDSREDWTKWIKGNLYDLIVPSRWIVSPLTRARTKGEFLTLDLCVEEREFPKRILLAAESELDNGVNRLGEILKDFEKLLAVKSPFKLMIFSSENRETTNEIIRAGIIRDLEGYGHHLRGETYILVDYNENSGKNGSFISHVWQPTSNGRPGKIDLVAA